ncbi:MAG: DUF309 domain-containing protein [Dehalococcoidia bacterium]|nr:DUF309 domain-containing protein [Dehalococcoidia bacterium]
MSDAPSRPPRGYITKRITVPGNLQKACDDFNAARFWECHEWLEEIWQEERGPVRDLYKGLIQVAAAFVHARRNNEFGVKRLLTTALGYLEPYRTEGALGFDVEDICTHAERALQAARELPDDRVHEVYPAHVPQYRFDAQTLPGEAIRWDAWGFDREGNPLEIEITVPD